MTQADSVESLSREACTYVSARLESMRAVRTPTPDDALVVARALRIEGDRMACRGRR